MQTSGQAITDKYWSVGIRNPFNISEIVKKVGLNGEGIATSGTYMRGAHIYNPIRKIPAEEILSLTVIAKNIFEADRFATATFAMGNAGINFIEKYPGLEGYAIDHKGIATMTSGFNKFAKNV